MFSNPLLQNLMLFFGAYTLMTMLKRYAPLHVIVTAMAVVVAVVIWLLRYNRAEAYRLYQNPAMRSVIDLVCSIAGDQPPVDAVPAHAYGPGAIALPPPVPVQRTASASRPRPVVSARNGSQSASAAVPAGAGSPAEREAARIVLRAPGDARLAAAAIKQQLFGMGQAIDDSLDQLVRNVRLREHSVTTVSLPPLGLFLFRGARGLGKRSLAVELARRIYADGAATLVDLGEAGQTIEPLLAAAKANPYQALVLENVDRASRRIQDDLLAMASGQPLVDSQTGARVAFRYCTVFLIVHAEASPGAVPVISGSRESFTIAVERTTEATTMDALLAQALHGVVPFHLPDKPQQARALARLMERECEKYQLTLRFIDAAVLAREVQDVSSTGSFSAAQSRVGRVMARAIHDAIDAGVTVVNVA